MSIDKLREKHSHHGLQLMPPRKIPPTLTEAAGALRAKSVGAKDGNKIGTFEIWHRYARHLPVVGSRTAVLKGGGRQSGPRVIFHSLDQRPPALPENGVSFLDCISRLPDMRHYLPPLGERSRLIRAAVAETVDERPDQPKVRHKITVQPNHQDLIDRFSNSIRFDANAWEQVNCVDFQSGFAVDWTYSRGIDDVYAELPEAFSVSQNEVYFLDDITSLNEFGYIYLALFILGMISRYYPDLWHREIETSTDLSIAAECLLNVAFRRLPVLALGELEGTYFLAP